jgi:deoxyribodipyrimidine photo-lyase
MAKSQSGASEQLRNLSSDSRVTVRRDGPPDGEGKCVVYWMQRAQRGVDNHAVDLAVKIANLLSLPLVAYFAAISNFPHANLRHYVFLNQGLPDIEGDLAARNISFVLRRASHESHERFLADVHAAFLIGDENPMREPERWRKQLASRIKIPFWTVDADVVVPSRLIEKAQYGAYTIRPRLYHLLPEYLHPCENLRAEHAWNKPQGFHADSVHEDITRGWKDFDRSVGPVEAWRGGTHAALKRLKLFTERLLGDYDAQRNHPEIDGTSCMSPYLHFGHVSPLTVALAVDAAAKANPKLKEARDSYFNELIVWRELAINFVRYTPKYDSPDCAESWAKSTIAEHARDEREHLYTLHQLEHAQTHDDLWNAGQIQMVRHGWMHNYVRMYWAKKILEWTPDVATAMKYAIHLNDKYFLDGRDPNGYAGIAWAILGKFDRAWQERPIFGKIRYMSGASTGKKFNSKRYIELMGLLPHQESLLFLGACRSL